MSDSITLARPYAEAIFQMLPSPDAGNDWLEALQSLALWVAQAESAEFLADPERSDADKVAFLGSVPVAVDLQNWQRFVSLLIENDRWQVAAEIADLFEQSLHQARGELDVVVRSSYPLLEGQRAVVTAALERRHPGQKVTLREELDPSILGGVIVQAGDEIIDASVRGQLTQLTQSLRI